MNSKLMNAIQEILGDDKRLWNTQKTELNQRLLFDLIDRYDEVVLSLLLHSEETKEKFFVQINTNYVFKTNDFKFFIDENKINNSFTKYINQIGLSDGVDLVKNRKEVVLDFPFKDCVLEGGQTNEDGIDKYYEFEEEKNKNIKGEKVVISAGYKEKQAKRKEIFFNQVLAQDEIDRLLDDKAFVNWMRHTKDGVQKVVDIKRDETGLIKENLVIKGNNLLALYSLKAQFNASIKLIYIDPPYNTGTDSFSYNDNFNHSTWLTFMKNRLEVAKSLLADDGVIFIQIDERELAYLKVLADEIFGRDNFVIQINWQRTTQRSVLGQGSTPIINIVEYILCYTKNSKLKNDSLNKIQKIIPSNDKMYNQYNLCLKTEGERELFTTLNHNGQEIRIYKHTNFELTSIPSGIRSENYYIENFDFIVRKDSQQKESTLEQMIISNIEKDGTLFSVERILKQGKKKGELNKTLYMNDNVIYYLKDYAEVIEDKIFRKVDMNNLWLDSEISSAGISEEGGVKLKRGKKPEELIKRIIEIGTNDENDIILDFHLGSGTTAAVAHKMKRQYIGIEQLDYGQDDSIERLKKVIIGEKSGISKSVNWQGGGNFIYCELAKWNENAKILINDCTSLNELISLFAILCDEYFLDYNLKVDEFKNKVVNEKEFVDLTFEEQKNIFSSMIDLNQLYVQESEMEDKKFGISEEDQRITNMFYEGGE